MQKMIITGHLGQDCRVNQVGNKTVINFSVASNERYPDQDGQLVEKTTWYNCAKWENKEGNLWKYLRKGQQVLIEGKLDAKLYATKDKKPAIDLSIRVLAIELLGSSKETSAEVDNTDWNMADFDQAAAEKAEKDEAFWSNPPVAEVKPDEKPEQPVGEKITKDIEVPFD